jgi:hypothetical protein
MPTPRLVLCPVRHGPQLCAIVRVGLPENEAGAAGSVSVLSDSGCPRTGELSTYRGLMHVLYVYIGDQFALTFFWTFLQCLSVVVTQICIRKSHYCTL